MRGLRVMVVVLVAGLGLACGGAVPATQPAPSGPAPSCCRMVQGVHNPRMDAAMCEDIGEWVTGEECRPTVCCRSSDGRAVPSTGDFCDAKPDNEALPLDHAACAG